MGFQAKRRATKYPSVVVYMAMDMLMHHGLYSSENDDKNGDDYYYDIE